MTREDYLIDLLNQPGMTADVAEDTFRRTYPDMTAEEGAKITRKLVKRRGGGRSGSYDSYSTNRLDTGNFAKDALNTQLLSKGNAPEFGTIEKSFGTFFDKDGLKSVPEVLKEIGKNIKGEVLIYLDEQSKLLTKINTETGMTGKLSEAFREEIMKATPEVFRLGITFEELNESVANIVKQSGKFKLMSEETIQEMALASKFTESMQAFSEMGPGFEKVGLGIKDMSSLVEKMGLKSMTLGLNARTTTKMVSENLKNLNSYGFKEGIEGLNKMTQKAIEFRMNMDSVFRVAEKVWDPDKALSMVANLQVIGGAFGDLNDPIKLMYMATNNVEGLQDAITGAAKSLVTFNEEQGRFQVTGINLRRAKAMADELGMSMDELTTTAVAAMERTTAASQLMGSGLQMNEEDKEFLTNLSQMKGGKMVIEVPKSLQEQLGNQTEIALDSMTQEQTNLLLEQKKAFEKMSMEDVARQQVTAMENIERDVSYLRASARVSVGMQIGDLVEKITGLDQTIISKESKRATDWVATQITKGDQLISRFMEKVPDVNLYGRIKGTINTEATAQDTKESKKETPKTTTKEETPPTKSVLEIKLSSSDVSLDGVKRELWNNPGVWMNKNQNDYLNNYIPNRTN
jgi:hypothetical protein